MQDHVFVLRSFRLSAFPNVFPRTFSGITKKWSDDVDMEMSMSRWCEWMNVCVSWDIQLISRKGWLFFWANRISARQWWIPFLWIVWIQRKCLPLLLLHLRRPTCPFFGGFVKKFFLRERERESTGYVYLLRVERSVHECTHARTHTHTNTHIDSWGNIRIGSLFPKDAILFLSSSYTSSLKSRTLVVWVLVHQRNVSPCTLVS
jgi:hypothetical protein